MAFSQQLMDESLARRGARRDVLRPSRPSEVQRMLATVPLFSECSKSELRVLARAAQIESRAAGAAIVTEGNTGTHAYVLLQGSCRVVRRGRRVGRVEAGAVVGELSMLNPAPRNATVEAETPCEIAVFGKRDFLELLGGSPSIGHKLLKNLARRVQEHDARLVVT